MKVQVLQVLLLSFIFLKQKDKNVYIKEYKTIFFKKGEENKRNINGGPSPCRQHEFQLLLMVKEDNTLKTG